MAPPAIFGRLLGKNPDLDVRGGPSPSPLPSPSPPHPPVGGVRVAFAFLAAEDRRVDPDSGGGLDQPSHPLFFGRTGNIGIPEAHNGVLLLFLLLLLLLLLLLVLVMLLALLVLLMLLVLLLVLLTLLFLPPPRSVFSMDLSTGLFNDCVETVSRISSLKVTRRSWLHLATRMSTAVGVALITDRGSSPSAHLVIAVAEACPRGRRFRLVQPNRDEQSLHRDSSLL